MKKARFLFAVLVVLALGLAACAPKPTPTAEPVAAAPTAEPAKPISVCVSLSGKLGDKSYNDSVAAGVYQAEKEFGITYKLLEANDAAAREPNLMACADGKYDLVIAIGSGQLDVVKRASEMYPDVKFAITDSILYPTPPNVLSVAFAPNEGQFLVGAAMAMFTTKTDIPGVNPEKVVGWITGTESPNILDFYAGFEHGVQYIDPEVKILKGVIGSFSDPIKGKEFALAQYEQGADIIAQVAAGSGLGIIEAAKEQKKFVVGVDLNQDDLAPGYVLTSMEKHVDVGVYNAIKSVVEGKFDGGGYSYMDLSTGAIKLTDFSTFKSVWGDKFPQDILDKVNELAAKIISGEIKVKTNPVIRFWEAK